MTLGPCGVYQQRSRGFHYLFDLAVACLRGCSTPLGVLVLRFGAERVQLLLRQGVAVVFGSPLTDSVNGYSHLAAAVYSLPILSTNGLVHEPARSASPLAPLA